MKAFEQPSMEFVSFGKENVIVTSCSTHNCMNPIGYGDLCSGPTGHSECVGYTPACPEEGPE